MATRSLYLPHSAALTALYGDLEIYARSIRSAFIGTAGSVLERKNAQGFRFYAHQYYDGTGKKVERYLAGPIGDPAADDIAVRMRARIAELKEIVPSLRLLGREGFNLVDPRVYATLASLHNERLFAAGAVLIGSHAYGALLNQLGVRAAQYYTRDVDIARAAKLALGEAPRKSFLEALQGSGIAFAEIPQLDKRKPGTSFKEPGKSLFQVDLLVPSDSEEVRTVPVPELQAHATALPYLRYLLGESQESMILAREGCCMLRVPTPERFALHKLLVSQLRKPRAEKSRKDISQACVLLAVLAEQHPGAIESAAEALPVSARRHIAAAAILAEQEFADNHPRAVEALNQLTTSASRARAARATPRPA
jgi:hypothetical protein